MSCRVVHGKQLTNDFTVSTGVRQGCLLSPFLFLLAIDWIMRRTTDGQKNGIQWTMWTQLDDLDFADDLALLSHTHRQMQDKTLRLEDLSAQVGLKIHRNKTKVLRTGTSQSQPVMLGGEELEEVDSFTYLGSIISKQGGTEEDIGARIGKARAVFLTLKNIWSGGGGEKDQDQDTQLECKVSAPIRL